MNTRLFAAAGALAMLCASAAAAQSWPIHTRGVGAASAGLSRGAAERRLGTSLRTIENAPVQTACDYLYPVRGFEGLSLMVQNGRVTRAQIRSAAFATRSGARVGDRTARLRQLYGNRLDIVPHKYDPTGFYYFVWEQRRRYGVKFEIAADTVSAIYAGDASIELVEGCA
jgi:hypothetical protein